MRQRYSLARLAGIDKKNHTLVNIKVGSPSRQDLLSKRVESNLFNKSSLRHLPNLDRAVLEGADNSPCVERVEVKVEDVALFVEERI